MRFNWRRKKHSTEWKYFSHRFHYQSRIPKRWMMINGLWECFRYDRDETVQKERWNEKAAEEEILHTVCLCLCLSPLSTNPSDLSQKVSQSVPLNTLTVNSKKHPKLVVYANEALCSNISVTVAFLTFHSVKVSPSNHIARSLFVATRKHMYSWAKITYQNALAIGVLGYAIIDSLIRL